MRWRGHAAVSRQEAQSTYESGSIPSDGGLVLSRLISATGHEPRFASPKSGPSAFPLRHAVITPPVVHTSPDRKTLNQIQCWHITAFRTPWTILLDITLPRIVSDTGGGVIRISSSTDPACPHVITRVRQLKYADTPLVRFDNPIVCKLCSFRAQPSIKLVSTAVHLVSVDRGPQPRRKK